MDLDYSEPVLDPLTSSEKTDLIAIKVFIVNNIKISAISKIVNGT